MLLVALIWIESSCGGGTEPPPAPVPNDYSPVLAFTSDRDGNPEIYVMDAAGEERRLTNNPGADNNPAWSADGTRIVFERENALWTMRADGSDVARLTNPPTRGLDWRRNGIPVPSSDGRVLYSRFSEEMNRTVRIVNIDGSNDHQLAEGIAPSWPSDGSLVAFTVFNNDISDVYLIRADGSQGRNLTNTPATREDLPVVSPDGQQVAFLSSSDGLTVMRTNGTGRTLVADDCVPNPPCAHRPAGHQWSPDGRQIAYFLARIGTVFHDVYVVNADGSGKRRLTTENHPIYAIRWAPDGLRIAIDTWLFENMVEEPNVLGRPYNIHIYVINADGSNFRRMTPSTSNDYQPAWKP